MYPVIDLAEYIVKKCITDEKPITNLQLQKILYYVQKAFLDHNDRAFSEPIEAWQFGPVVPKVYYRFGGFGAMPITITGKNNTISEKDAAIIDPIVESKREMYPWDLVADTHKPGGAWAQTYRNGEGNHQTISEELIRSVG
jgi:uncharacterized phage-associated protein